MNSRKNRLDDHPTVLQIRANGAHRNGHRKPISADWLRELCLKSGADDVGFVEIDRPDVADQRPGIDKVFRNARALISIVVRLNRENIRSPGRSVANLETHRVADDTNEVCHRIVAALEQAGVRAINISAGFPIEMGWYPLKPWIIEHKPIAVAAGLGKVGVHRMVIHPKFGNFISLCTVVLDTEIDSYGRPIEFNPCLECKLCVAACPTGAVRADGDFNFAACYTHNYREFMGGFVDWVETVADSRNAQEYRNRVEDNETFSVWQSLTYGASYKSGYCMSVCPAGEDVIGPFLDNRKSYLDDVVRPLQEKVENVYVVPGGDAEQHVAKRFPHKRVRKVSHGMRPRTVDGLFKGMAPMFQPGQAGDLSAVYHFTFTGAESRQLTFKIHAGKFDISEGHHGDPDIRVTTDTRTWMSAIAKETPIPWEIIRRRIKVRGPLRLLRALGKCFPI
jgi:ferredoxin